MLFELLLALTQGASLVQTFTCFSAESQWIFPHPPNHKVNMKTGQNYTLQWTSNFQDWYTYCYDAYFQIHANISNLDLWISWGNSSHIIQSSIDVSTTFKYEWSARIPTASHGGYSNSSCAFAFSPHGRGPAIMESLADDVSFLSSPEFQILAAATSAVRSPTAATLVPPYSDPDPRSLSTSAKAGIGVGVGVGALALSVVGVWYVIRCRRKEASTMKTSGSVQYLVELDPYSDVPAELHHESRYELDGNWHGFEVASQMRIASLASRETARRSRGM